MSFPRKARITQGAELQRVAREGKRIRTRYIEVRAATSPLARSVDRWKGMRVGLIIPRFKHSAVLRNLLKRRLRELVRIELIPSTLLVDIVIRIRPSAYEATFAELVHDIRDVLEQLERWCVTNQESSAVNELCLDKKRETS